MHSCWKSEQYFGFGVDLRIIQTYQLDLHRHHLNIHTAIRRSQKSLAPRCERALHTLHASIWSFTLKHINEEDTMGISLGSPDDFTDNLTSLMRA